MTEPGLRVSDEDRRRVVAALERHTAAGRLDLDEFADRVDRALAARTHGDLRAVTHDLPADAAARAADSRALLVAFAIASLTLVVLGALLAVAR